MFKNKEEQFDFYWKEIFTGLTYNPIEFNTYRFDQTMSLPGKVNKLYDMFKVLAMNNQEVMDYLKEFVETFDEKLYKTVEDVLKVWLDDGLLADIVREAINEEVVEARNDYSTLKERLDSENTDVKTRLAQTNERLTQTDTQLKNMSYKRINVRDYGAKGDGVTDDSQAIKDAISALDKNGGILEFPTGVYLHGDGITTGLSYESEMLNGKLIPLRTQSADVGRDIRFLFEGYKNLTILGNNSTILSHERNGETRNNAIFHFQNCDNLKVYDIKVDGNIETRKPILGDYDDGTGKIWRSNINVITCRDIYFKNVVSSHSMLDGIIAFSYSSNQSYNHVYENCVCNYNYRQGLTISSVNDVDVIRGEYSYNATIYGTLPKSGIDVEADAGTARNIKLLDVVFRENENWGLIFSFRSEGIVADGCRFYNDGVLLESPSNHGNVIKNSFFYNTKLTIAQNSFKILNNTFIYDVPSDYFEIDCYNVAYQNKGEYPEFIGNTVKCLLPQTIDTGNNLKYGLMRLQNDRLIIKNNNFINLYSTQTKTLPYIITLVGKIISGNIYKYDGVLSLEKTQFNIYTSNGGTIEGNKVEGYEAIYTILEEWQSIPLANDVTGSIYARTVKGRVELKGNLIPIDSVNYSFVLPPGLRSTKTIKFFVFDDTSYLITHFGSTGQVYCPTSAIGKNLCFDTVQFSK